MESSVYLNTDVFINFSNHCSSNWSEAQLKAEKSLAGGQIVDIQFPEVDSSGDESYIKELALKYVNIICDYKPCVVMCQGEFGLTFQVVSLLKKRNICSVYSCSERVTIEQKTDTDTIKTSNFQFVRFREY